MQKDASAFHVRLPNAQGDMKIRVGCSQSSYGGSQYHGKKEQYHLHFHSGCSIFSVKALGETRRGHGNLLQRLVFSVENPCAEFCGPSATDNRGAHDVRSLVESEPVGDAIFNNGLAIAINPADLFAVDPPHRRRVGADSQSHITHLAWAVDDGHSPEQNIGSILALRAGEVKEVDVIIHGVHVMLGEFCAACGHLVAIARYDS